MSNNQSAGGSLKIKREKRSRLAYYRRVFSAYLGKGNSHLTFWHGVPQVNDNTPADQLGEYYMPFLYKADYPGPFNDQGIPLLDYHGKVSLQYNPIAIAQYALAHYNLLVRTSEQKHFDIFLKQVDWLVRNLEMNSKGLYVWNHHFDWEYREVLEDPWYSALAQGQGISALVRAYSKTGRESYIEAAQRALESFKYEIRNGGVKYTDDEGYIWLEEAIVEPPTHILNGFIWALWGIYDYYLVTHDVDAKHLFDDCVGTLKDNLATYDIGFWSLYEHSGTRLKMIASPFYHSLHIVQLRVMYRLTDEEVFREFAQRWTRYRQNWLYRKVSLVYKLVFKLVHY